MDSQKVLEAHKEVSHDKGYPTKLDFKDMFKLELEVVHIEMARIKHSIYIFLFLSLFLFLISLLLKVCNYSPKFSVVCACAGFIMSVCMFFHIYSFTERYKELRKALMRFYERKERYIKSFDCDMTSNFYNICGTNNSYEIMDVRWGYYVISIVYYSIISVVLYLFDKMKDIYQNNIFKFYSSENDRINVLLENFTFFHRPSTEEQIDPKYRPPVNAFHQFTNWLKENEAKSAIYLITGYRGAGKSSFVNYVIRNLNRPQKKKFF